MKNKVWIFIIVSLFIIIGVGVYFSIKNNVHHNDNNYDANRVSTSNTQSDNDSSNSQNTSIENNENDVKENKNGITQTSNSNITEEPLASFSTKIYSSDKARQNNIQITCNSLNGTTVKNGATFSFCNTVGKATSSKGYQEADIFNHDGKKQKGLGGGNCQVSSTLYNAVLEVSGLQITERHSHSNKVPYVSKGKDAAVAYGSYDLKFVNNLGNDLKIKASTDGKNVIVNLISLKNS